METGKIKHYKSNYIVTQFKTIFAITLCSIYSCTSTNEGISNTVKMKFHESSIIATDFSDSFNSIKPESATNDAIITNIERVLGINDRFFVVDRIGNKIIAYDKDGKFINSTTRLQGRGKGEYIRISDATIDTDDNLIFAYCDAPYQIMVYDIDLNYKYTINLDFYAKEIAVEGNHIYTLCQSDKEGEINQFELRCYKKNDMSKYDVLLKHEKTIADVRGFGKSMNSDGEHCYISLPFDNSIYCLDNGKIENIWTINFNGQWFDYEKAKIQSKNDFFDSNKENNWMIQNICFSDSIIIFNTNKTGVNIMNLNSKECDYYTSIIFPFELGRSWLMPIGGMKSSFCYNISANTIVEYARFINTNNRIYKNESHKCIYDKYDSHDNPLFITAKIR